MILIISGYRDFNDYALFSSVLDEFLDKNKDIEKVIFGECRGTDALALRYMKKNIIPYEIYNAEWGKYGKGAGPIRNNKMVEIGTDLIAFLSEESKGTKQIIKKAQEKGLNVYVVNI